MTTSIIPDVFVAVLTGCSLWVNTAQTSYRTKNELWWLGVKARYKSKKKKDDHTIPWRRPHRQSLSTNGKVGLGLGQLQPLISLAVISLLAISNVLYNTGSHCLHSSGLHYLEMYNTFNCFHNLQQCHSPHQHLSGWGDFCVFSTVFSCSPLSLGRPQDAEVYCLHCLWGRINQISYTYVYVYKSVTCG